MSKLDGNVLLSIPSHPKEPIKTDDPTNQLHRFNIAGLRSRFARFKYELSQMELPAPVLILTPWRAFGCMTLFGVILLIYGIAILVGCLSLHEYSVEFTNASDKGTVSIPITYSTSGDVFIYIKLDQMYQNVEWYSKSVSQSQLSGGSVSATDSLCSPWANGSYPCGLVAASVYTDTFTFRIKRSGDATSSYLSIDESSATISSLLAKQTTNPSVSDYNVTDSTRATNPFWILRYFPPTICRPITADLSPTTTYTVALDSYNLPQCTSFSSTSATCIYSPTCDSTVAQEILNPAGWGVENSHVRNWLTTSSLPTVMKLWAKVSVPLYAGDVIYIDVRQNWAASGVTKTIVFSETNWQGGPSTFLPSCLIAVGGSYIIAAILLYLAFRIKPRIMGDISSYQFAEASIFQTN